MYILISIYIYVTIISKTPFQDHTIYKEQLDKISFWETTDFYGVDLSAMTELAYNEFFSQPIVGILLYIIY